MNCHWPGSVLRLCTLAEVTLPGTVKHEHVVPSHSVLDDNHILSSQNRPTPGLSLLCFVVLLLGVVPSSSASVVPKIAPALKNVLRKMYSLLDKEFK